MIRPGIVGIAGMVLIAGGRLAAQNQSRLDAMRAAIHPVATVETMRAWLSRVPITRDFPEDLPATLRGPAIAWKVEMSTGPDCLPCGDLWTRLQRLGRTYGWPVHTITTEEAMMRSGRLGLPWVGHPVAWVKSASDPQRMVPVAIGTDHEHNLTRNIYLAAKMLAGVRPAVGVRAMSKFTGIVGTSAPSSQER